MDRHIKSVLVRCKVEGDKEFYPSDIAQALDLDYDVVCRAIESLVRKGLLREVNEPPHLPSD